MPPSGRLLKVPLMGLAEVLLIKVSTIPCVKTPIVWPLKAIIAPLLIVTPLAITWSVLALFCFALNVQVEVASVLKVSALWMVSVACTVVPAAGARKAPLPVPTVTAR